MEQDQQRSLGEPTSGAEAGRPSAIQSTASGIKRALLVVLGALIGVAQRDALRAETQGRLAGAFSDDFADTLFYVSFVGGLVMALRALRCRRGPPPRR